jgi:hypothetical protein
MNDERPNRGGDHDYQERKRERQRLDEITKMMVRVTVSAGSIGHDESSRAAPSLCSLVRNPIFR